VFCFTTLFTINVDVSLLDIMDSNIMHSRGHSLKIMKQHCRINAMLHSFACRNVNERNALPKMLFVVNLEPHSRDLLIELIFLSFCLFSSFLGGDEGMGRRQNQF